MSNPTDTTPANDEAAPLGLEGVDAFVNSRALEILREWINEPEMLEILEKAELIEPVRKEAA